MDRVELMKKIDKEREKLHKLLDEKGKKHPDFLKQNALLDKLINQYNKL